MSHSKSKGYGWESGHDLLKEEITIRNIQYDPIFVNLKVVCMCTQEEV